MIFSGDCSSCVHLIVPDVLSTSSLGPRQKRHLQPVGRQTPVRHGPPNPGVISVHPLEHFCQVHAVITRRESSFIVYMTNVRSTLVIRTDGAMCRVGGGRFSDSVCDGVPAGAICIVPVHDIC